ncbi:allatostatin C-like [Leptopilina boulardi]|uniref:allatostatin C-like n=1 Tax=Leptopilina boulardi TaxID=63433 RepID=UPI0021F565B1|nr:allatostatin C-like [Leptopilina boulardi]XP_051176570.1 allatostatin C-like [Leptopilina boulardi]
MVSVRVMACFGIVLITLVHWSTCYPTVDKESLQNEIDTYDDNGPENAALLYKLLRRLGTQLAVGELQRKRSYWKQCAFNAVSCYGK